MKNEMFFFDKVMATLMVEMRRLMGSNAHKVRTRNEQGRWGWTVFW